MILRLLAALSLLLATASAQTFTAADVRPAPHRSYPFFYAVLLHQDRYVVRDATMVDLVATAYGLDRDNIQGGPAWVDYNRFDILAKVPPGTAKPALQLMLRALLSERFGLTAHNGVAPMPAYILTAVKPRLKRADASEPSACEDKGGPYTGATYLIDIACTNLSMDAAAERLHQLAGGYLTSPAVNATHLDESYDFELKWSNRADLEKAGPDGISLFDALEKQLGLKLSLETAPRPVVLVEAVSRTPTPNLPGIEKLLPPTSGSQFEVATLKPAKPGEHANGRISGGVVNFTDISLKDMIDLAWDLNENDPEVLVHAPKWVNDDHYDVLAKVAPDSSGVAASSGGDLPMDVYEIQLMLQALLIERFQIVAHMEDRPIGSWQLIAVNPKLKPADPTTRTACKEGPGPDSKDPRLANPVLNRLVSCRNMTMPEFIEELQHLAGGYIFNSVQDSTGLKGGFDFTLSFSSADRVLPGAQTGSDPNGALSIFDAVKSQLGLKLEKQKRNLPALFLDHIEEKPTEN